MHTYPDELGLPMRVLGNATRASCCALLLVIAIFPALGPAAGYGGLNCTNAVRVEANDVHSSHLGSGPQWFRHFASGPATYTVSYTAVGLDQGVYLGVYDDDCGSALCSAGSGGQTTFSCSVPAGYNFRVVIVGVESWGGYDYTLTFSGQPPAQCHDGLDNDGDGNVDYPADPGCPSKGDNSEGPTCPPTSPGVVVCLEPGNPYQTLARAGPSPTAVAAYLDLYQFRLPNGVVTNLLCVVTALNPCAMAGGTFVSREETLVELDPTSSQQGGIEICEAELTVLAYGMGVPSAPAYALCG